MRMPDGATNDEQSKEIQIYNVIGLGPMTQLVKLAKRNKRSAKNVQESQLKDTPGWRL